jgi:hypothetical protein
VSLIVSTRPPGRVPQALTAVQFWLVCDSIGFTRENVLALIDFQAVSEGWPAQAWAESSERRGVTLRLDRATTFPRDWPMLELIAASMTPPLTPAQIDDLYRWGATL